MTLWGIVIIASLACLALKTIGCLVCKTALDKPATSRVANLTGRQHHGSPTS